MTGVRIFPIVVSIDLFALCLPTQWMGARMEMTMAVVLSGLTAAYWFVRWINE